MVDNFNDEEYLAMLEEDDEDDYVEDEGVESIEDTHTDDIKPNNPVNPSNQSNQSNQSNPSSSIETKSIDGYDTVNDIIVPNEELNYLAKKLSIYMDITDTEPVVMRGKLDMVFQGVLRSQGNATISTDELLLSFGNTDIAYKDLLVKMLNFGAKGEENIVKASNSKNRDVLASLLGIVISNLAWNEVAEVVEKNNLNVEALKSRFSQVYEGLHSFRIQGLEIHPNILTLTDDVSISNKSIYKVVYESIAMLRFVNTPEALKVTKVEEVTTMQEKPINSRDIVDKTLYIQELKRKGFKPITNSIEVAGKLQMHDTMLGVIKSLYTKTPMVALGYIDKVNMVNSTLLASLNKNPKQADIWDPGVYALDEDLMFRLFVKEDDISFTILMKLPNGLNNFNFSNANDLETIAYLFSNMDASKGKVYSASMMGKPRVCNLGNTQNVNCAYDCIEIVLAKDLMAFKNSSWLLRNYIRACHGEENEFSTFNELSLGEKIVTGVMPGALKAERFDCSGKFNTSGIVGGGAGSGKTAMYDSLLVQGVALKGVEGNGALMLIDAKQEWIPSWRRVFNQLNVPFYGFDGSILDSSELKWKLTSRGKDVVENIPFTVSSYVAGILFSRVIYETIQLILSETGCEDVKEFNSSNKNYKGITRLPRTMILVDELNTLNKNLRTVKELKRVYDGMILARLTRTSGFLWFLGGQDPSKTVIPGDERSNYKYNIFGNMASERYEYFDVVQNKAVVEYENKNRTPENPSPILSQGMFYAGPQGKTDLVKSLYVPSDERVDAIRDLGSNLAGMYELDKLVKLALKEGYFHKFEVTLKKPNNIIYSTLKNLGIITQQEFETYTEMALSGSSMEDDNSLDDILAGGSDDEESLYNTGSKLNAGVDVKGLDLDASPRTNTDSVFDFLKVNSSNSMNTEKDRNKPVKESMTDNVSSINSKQANNQSNNGNMKASSNESRSNTRDSIRNDSYTSPINNVGYSNVFTDKIELSNNPFTIFGTSDSPISCLNSISMMSTCLMDEIKKLVGDYSRIESIEITGNGLVINDIAFRPTFSKEDLDTMPFTIREKVSRGDVSELFYFKDLYKFKNLVVLRVDNPRMAEGRMRREMGIAPKKSWYILFNHFRYLSKLYIGGERIVDEGSATLYDKQGRGGYSLTESLRNKFNIGINLVSSSRMDKFWDSKPVELVTGALGWTLGVKALMLTA